MGSLYCILGIVIAVALGILYGWGLVRTTRKQRDYFRDPWRLRKRRGN